MSRVMIINDERRFWGNFTMELVEKGEFRGVDEFEES